MPIGIDAHCDILTSNIRDSNKRIYDGFSLFAKLMSAIVGASVWLRVEHEADILPQYSQLSDGLVILVAVICIMIISDNLRAWYRYRQKISKVAGKEVSGHLCIPEPRFYTAARIEITMLLVIIIASYLFIAFNPLSLPA